jgi:hypothetical protein
MLLLARNPSVSRREDSHKFWIHSSASAQLDPEGESTGPTSPEVRLLFLLVIGLWEKWVALSLIYASRVD